jgi:hypothetical protein
MAYARMHAIISAMYFADRICPDGCLATGHGYYGKHFRKKTDNGVKVEAGGGSSSTKTIARISCRAA